MLEKVTKFFDKDLWRIDIEEMSKSKFFLIQQLRIFVLAYRGFSEDQINTRASALTFYTLISIVPVIAMAFGIAKGFGFEETMNQQIKSAFANQQEIADMLLDFSQSMLEKTKGGLVAGIGLIVLFWSVLKVLTNIELSFNAVWGISKERNWVRKFTEYLSIMLIAPIFIILSGSATVFIASTSSELIESYEFLKIFGSAVHFFLRFLPLILIWLLFSFIYVAIPNTKVLFKHALFGGVIAGTGYQLLEWAYFTFQIGAVKYNAIYGSFAALPLFLIWLQSSWLIILFGCEISFASQNVNKYIFEKETANISISFRKKITLLMLVIINKNFTDGNKPFTVADFATKLKLPVRLIQLIIDDLIAMELLLEAYTDKIKLIGYSPAKSLDSLSVKNVLELIEKKGSEDIPIKSNRTWEWIEKNYANIIHSAENENLKIKDISNL